MSTGSKALDRPVHQWLSDIAAGKLHLPSFQRGEAWDRRRIESMLRTIIRDLPLGITLVLDVGEEEQFHSRPLVTAPQTHAKVTEHLLDGQQRLTALWRSLKGNYEDRKFFVHHPLLDEDPQNDDDGVDVWSYTTWKNKNGQLMPRWTEDPAQCAQRGLVPVHLLDPASDDEVGAWIEKATSHLKPALHADSDATQIFAAMEAYDARRRFLKDDVVSPLRETVKHYRLPYLNLPASTPKSVALEVFINMNTNAKPLRPFDIVVAEVENATGARLQEMIDTFVAQHPHVGPFGSVSDLLLQTIALHQDLSPNKSGFFSLDADRLVKEWDLTLQGLLDAIELLGQMRIWDAERLPTAVAVPVVAAMFVRAPKLGDARGWSNMSAESTCGPRSSPDATTARRRLVRMQTPSRSSPSRLRRHPVRSRCSTRPCPSSTARCTRFPVLGRSRPQGGRVGGAASHARYSPRPTTSVRVISRMTRHSAPPTSESANTTTSSRRSCSATPESIRTWH